MAHFRAANCVLGSIHSAEMAEPGNSLLKSFSLQYWDEWWLASPCLERALVQRVRWAADARAGVVCDGQVFLLVKSGTWGGSGIRNDEPESQWATFSPPSGTEDFAAGEKLLPGSNVQTQMLEVMTQMLTLPILCGNAHKEARKWILSLLFPLSLWMVQGS